MRTRRASLLFLLGALVLWRGLALPVHQTLHTAEHLAEDCQDHDGARHWHRAEARHEACALCTSLSKPSLSAPGARACAAPAPGPSGPQARPDAILSKLCAFGPYRRGPPQA